MTKYDYAVNKTMRLLPIDRFPFVFFSLLPFDLSYSYPQCICLPVRRTYPDISRRMFVPFFFFPVDRFQSRPTIFVCLFFHFGNRCESRFLSVFKNKNRVR